MTEDIKTEQAIENLFTMSAHYLEKWERRERIKTMIEHIVLLSIAGSIVSVAAFILFGG